MLTSILSILTDSVSAASRWFYSMCQSSGLVPLVALVIVFSVFARLLILPLIGGSSLSNESKAYGIRSYDFEKKDGDDK